MTNSSASSDPNVANPLWRLENLYLIRTKDSRVAKLKLNRIQRMLMDRCSQAVLSGRPVQERVLKYRQGGVSTFFLLLHLDRTIFSPNTTTGILADLKENLGYLFEIVRFAHETMPDGLRPQLGSDSKTELTFPQSGSKIMVSLAIKSTTLHGLHVSEHAHMQSEDVKRTIGACTPDAWVTSETTAKGLNFYRDEWVEWRQDGTPTIFLPWPLQDEYRIPGPGKPDDLPPIVPDDDEKRLAARIKSEYGLDMDSAQFRYRRQKKKELKQLFAQEMAESEDECFLATGGVYFQASKILVLIEEAKRYNAEHPALTGPCWEMWEERQQGHLYVAAADVMNEGGGPDPDWHVLAIVCATCRKTAFRYRSRVGIDAFYRVCREWGIKYNNALLAPESNAHGKAVILGLREKGYPNLFVRNRRQRAIGEVKAELKYGWETTPTTKPAMLDRLKVSLEGEYEDDERSFEPEILWLDVEFLKETLNIVEEDGKIGATSGKHDDMVMTYAIAMQLYHGARPVANGLASRGIILGDKLESATEPDQD